MKVPISWIQEFVDLDSNKISAEQLAEEISLKAFEVEKVEYIGPNITGPLVSGKILEITKHPNADKLQITKTLVKEGQEPQQIVCGAKNIQVGQIVPVALPGAIVTNRKTGKPLPIKIGKIRDIESCGMLCSGDELGIDSDIDGIYILPNEWKVGINLIEEMDLVPEAVLDIESRSNRGDALSMLGIAREIAATIDSELKLDYYKKDIHKKFTEQTSKLAKLKAEIADKKSCSKIGFLRIKDLKVKQSPEWLTKRLEAAGVSSINNVVDITNYIMLEIGQPMHAYDSSKVNNKGSLKVQYADKAKFKGLDEKEYTLNNQHLVIADEDKVLGIAGVMGGKGSSVQDNTTDIILEAASFSFAAVRHTSRSVGTISESSKRFERGTDPELIEIALYRAAELIQELSGGTLESYVIEESTGHKQEKKEIDFKLQEYTKIIGAEITIERTISILEKLGFTITKKSANELTVEIPSYRQRDIQRTVDLIEELVRFEGLNNVESKPLPGVSKLLPINASKKKLKNILIQQGYSEAISSSLVPADQPVKGSLLKNHLSIQMKNPLSKDHSELRDSISYSLLNAVSYNLRRQNSSIRLFEFGKVYGYKENSIESVSEIETLGIVLSSKGKELSWQGNQSTTSDFYELKGIIECLCLQKGRLIMKPIEVEDNSNALLHPKVSATIQFNGRNIGYLGKVHPQISKNLELPQNTYIAEVMLEAIAKEAKVKAKPISDNPSLSRDITIDLRQDTNLNHSIFNKKIQEAKISSLKDVQLISSYRAKNSDTTSLSYRLSFQSDSDKLLGEEINTKIQNFKDKLVKEFSGITFRDGE